VLSILDADSGPGLVPDAGTGNGEAPRVLTGAILRTQILPRWVGGAAVVWAVVWTVLYLGRIGKAPLGPNLITGLFGLDLLVHRSKAGPGRALLASPRRGAGDPADGTTDDSPSSV
jgi:hypothetical protein